MKKAIAPERKPTMKAPSLPRRNHKKSNGAVTGKIVGIGVGTAALTVGAIGLGASKILTKGGKALAKRSAKQTASAVTP